MIEAKKWCPKCKKLLSIQAFHRNAGRPRGLHGYCIECKAVNDKKYRFVIKRKNYVRSYLRAGYDKNRYVHTVRGKLLIRYLQDKNINLRCMCGGIATHMYVHNADNPFAMIPQCDLCKVLQRMPIAILTNGNDVLRIALAVQYEQTLLTWYRVKNRANWKALLECWGDWVVRCEPAKK